MQRNPLTLECHEKFTVKLSGSRETSVFCLVRRGGGKVGVARGEGREGGSGKAGDGDGEGGTVGLLVCKARVNDSQG